MKNFGLIFVLYHPTEEFLANLSKARAVCSSVVAVDNSPEADLQLHEVLREQGMQVIFNRNEGGLAGAYNKGAEALLAKQVEAGRMPADRAESVLSDIHPMLEYREFGSVDVVVEAVVEKLLAEAP